MAHTISMGHRDASEGRTDAMMYTAEAKALVETLTDAGMTEIDAQHRNHGDQGWQVVYRHTDDGLLYVLANPSVWAEGSRGIAYGRK